MPSRDNLCNKEKIKWKKNKRKEIKEMYKAWIGGEYETEDEEETIFSKNETWRADMVEGFVYYCLFNYNKKN